MSARKQFISPQQFEVIQRELVKTGLSCSETRILAACKAAGIEPPTASETVELIVRD